MSGPARGRSSLSSTLFGAAGGVFLLFLLGVMLSGRVWLAVAYGVVALFALLVGLAVYFWGWMLIGGLVQLVKRGVRTPVPWALDGEPDAIPEHDLDPGLELLAAGLLVFRGNGARPEVFFRHVPLDDAHAVQPFVIARTGFARDVVFEFALADEARTVLFQETVRHELRRAPQAVLPRARIGVKTPHRFAGQRWSLNVRSGVTVVAHLGFEFVSAAHAASEPWLDWQRESLPRLIDEALRRSPIGGAALREIPVEES